MSEDIKIDLPEGAETEQTTEAAGDNSVTLSPVEARAAEQGWKPKEEWVAEGGDPDEWRSAREFVDRGELLKQIHQSNRKVKQVEQSFGALKQHHAQVYDKAYKDAMTALRKERREAMIDGDIDRVEVIEDRIEETRQEFQKTQAQLQAEAQANEPAPQFVAWVERNAWYENNSDLREFADVLGIAYARKHPGIDPQEVLKHVEQEVKKKFPEEAGVRKAAKSPVTSVNRTSQKAANSSNDIDLTDTERDIMNTLVRSKVMTKEQYIAELKKVKGN